jgi:ABC-type transporter Mla MlaB component
MSLQLDTRQTPPTATLSGELSIMTLGDLQDDLFGLLNFADLNLDLNPLEALDGCGAQLIAILQGKRLRLLASDECVAHCVLTELGLWADVGSKGAVHGHQ